MGLQDFVLRNFLILGLFLVITIGLLFPQPGLAVHQLQIGQIGVPQVAVVIIFIVSGLCLDSVADMLQPKALFIGTVLVLGVTPLIAWPILVFGDGHVSTILLQGMALFCVVPTTLSSGVTMVTQAKGNVSLAILLTSVTNILGIFVLPWSVSRIFAATVHISPVEMLFELVWLTLVPLLVGLWIRKVSEPIRAFVSKRKKPLGLTQNSCILTVVWLMASTAQAEIVATATSDLAACVALAAGIHLVYRIVGYAVATAANLAPREWVTIVLMCSQKSLPVCVSVLSALPSSLKAKGGLLIVPCIMAHAAQLVIDSMLAVRWEVVEETTKAPLLG